ncbi:MAG: hypothetical protein KGL39_07820 [Patescibacteria group bacterium]|nr:hypothetical protein [Patescibacteria group bacterium]
MTSDAEELAGLREIELTLHRAQQQCEALRNDTNADLDSLFDAISDAIGKFLAPAMRKLEEAESAKAAREQRADQAWLLGRQV